MNKLEKYMKTKLKETEKDIQNLVDTGDVDGDEFSTLIGYKYALQDMDQFCIERGLYEL